MKYSRRRVKRRRRGSVRFAGIAVRSLAFLAVVAASVALVRRAASDHESSAQTGTFSRVTTSQTSDLSSFFQAQAIQPRNRRVVYPYSIVPGGVTSAAELREAAEHDPTVGEHYRGFDYTGAHVVEVSAPRLVYLSYRRHNKVYWTRKQASLHKGEKLLTDGKIAARTRCGNQVSVLPQAQTAADEPTIAELDRPDAIASGMESFPSNFESSLLQVDPGLPLGPISPGVGGFPTAGTPPGGFIPLPIGGWPGTPISSGCVPKPDKPCTNPPPPPPPPPPPVPEPETLVLVASGAAAIVARLRKNRSN